MMMMMPSASAGNRVNHGQLFNAELMCEKEPSEKSKTNAELLSVDGVAIMLRFGFDSTLDSTTVEAFRSKIAPLFIKKGYPRRKGRGKLSMR